MINYISPTLLCLAVWLAIFPVTTVQGESEIPSVRDKKVLRTLNEISEFVLGRCIIEELEAKDISLRELCRILNRESDRYKAIFDFGQELRFEVEEEIAERTVFFHIKNVALQTILNIATEQNGCEYRLKEGKVVIWIGKGGSGVSRKRSGSSEGALVDNQ